jgi:hypothetical protein
LAPAAVCERELSARLSRQARTRFVGDVYRMHALLGVVHDGDVPLPAQERGQRRQPREQAHGPARGAGMDPDLASACRIVEQHAGHLRLAYTSSQDATAPTVLITLPRISALQDGATGSPRRLPRAAS